MNSIKNEYIYMPRNDDDYRHVVGEYTARGLPGCIGSVDYVHIAWDRCPAMYKNMFKGKEGFCSIAYEVVCNCRKFIQSVSVGHPGTRNDKHIVRTDQSAMDLLEGNGWLNSKTWCCSTGVDGIRKLHRGVYRHKHSTWIAIITRVPGQIIKVGISTCSSTKIGDFTH